MFSFITRIFLKVLQRQENNNGDGCCRHVAKWVSFYPARTAEFEVYQVRRNNVTSSSIVAGCSHYDSMIHALEGKLN